LEVRWSEAFTVFLAALNTAPCFAGHCDWRIPNVKELQSIVDYGRLFPDFPAIAPGFPGSTAFDLYWSSTTVSNIPSRAWLVNFAGGAILPLDGTNIKQRVRAVRNGP
jgi:hypothetical protein